MSVGSRLPTIRRSAARALKFLLPPVASVVMALAIVAVPLAIGGFNPLVVSFALMAGAFGGRFAIGSTLIHATPLIFTGLAFIVAFRAGLFNVGTEGQLQLGALAAALVGLLEIEALPPVLHIGLALASGCLAGCAWALIAGVMRAFGGINEIVSTMMLNFVGIYLTYLMFMGPFADPTAAYGTTPVIAATAELPFVMAGMRLHAGFLIAVFAVLVVNFLLMRTVQGLQLRAVGGNPNAARYAGISVSGIMLLSMAVSGGLAGLGGAIEILGVSHRIGENWSIGWGFKGIAVALLAQLQPLGIFFSAVLFGALEAGAVRMQSLTGVPGSFINLVQGLPVLLLIVMSSDRVSRLVKGRARHA